MNIQVHSKHLRLTDALQEYLEKKIGRLEKYLDVPPDHDPRVNLSIERGEHRVEMTMTLPGAILRAEETSDDMYKSIDLAVDKLQRQIQRYKAKFHHKPHEREKLFHEEHGTRDTTEEQAEAERDREPVIVRRKQFLMKPMRVDEAVLQLELLAHDFFVFTNADAGAVNVVYRRRDGNYGLIETV
jgi:putative sigma-54 modulation protein